MADKLVPSVDDTGAVRRFVDMGDGTYAERVAVAGGVAGSGNAGYPAGAVPVAAAFNVANATGTGTLPAAAGKTTYVTGVQISGLGATAQAQAAASITGVLGSGISIYINVPAGASIPVAPVTLQFSPPLPASAVNTAIALSLSPFGAGNLAATGSIQGFQL